MKILSAGVALGRAKPRISITLWYMHACLKIRSMKDSKRRIDTFLNFKTSQEKICKSLFLCQMFHF